MADAIWSVHKLLSWERVGTGRVALPGGGGNGVGGGGGVAASSPSTLHNILRAVEVALPRMNRGDACNKALLALAVRPLYTSNPVDPVARKRPVSTEPLHEI